MPAFSVPALYERHYGGDKARAALFHLVREWLGPARVMYAGSFIHVAASFAFQSVTYVDTDRNARRFFAEPDEVRALVNRHKAYPEEPEIVFHGISYEEALPEPDESFDLLVSLYAGFISDPCRRYLRPGGILLANNSHGDAALAQLSPHYELAAVVLGSGEQLRISEVDLDSYFVPKRNVTVTEEMIRETGRGVAYSKPAVAYLFRCTG
jgi:hypothetical protein